MKKVPKFLISPYFQFILHFIARQRDDILPIFVLNSADDAIPISLFRSFSLSVLFYIEIANQILFQLSIKIIIPFIIKQKKFH